MACTAFLSGYVHARFGWSLLNLTLLPLLVAALALLAWQKSRVDGRRLLRHPVIWGEGFPLALSRTGWSPGPQAGWFTVVQSSFRMPPVSVEFGFQHQKVKLIPLRRDVDLRHRC